MRKVASIAKVPLKLSDEDQEDLRLAGLLHDVGHYPYSHLMEKIDRVELTEEFVEDAKTINASAHPYAGHEDVGELIVTSQGDLIRAIGGRGRAENIAQLFRGTPVESGHLARLIHSSLDMDRLDYLLRDAHAAGVPYGRIDLNYLLNNLCTSPNGIVAISEKALPAAEQYLLARFFMYRTVYYHKTTFGLEEACRQLLRRARDCGRFGIARDGEAIRRIVTSSKLWDFTDAYVDAIVNQAARSRGDPVVLALAKAIRNRRPPKLLKEVFVFEDSTKRHHAGVTFRNNCRHELKALAEEHHVPLGQFLFCVTPPLMLEQRGSRLTEAQARQLKPEEREELIKIWRDGADEPESIVNIEHSLLSVCSNHFFQTFRLYFVYEGSDDDGVVRRLREAVSEWDQS
jgi:HD superfamily phosphohydrolase